MIPDTIKIFVESLDAAFVASADGTGVPHLAVGREPNIPDPDHLAFEAWFCRTTLKNVTENPRVAVAVVMPDSGSGYQFIGTVEQVAATALLDGQAGEDIEPPGMPQVQSRLLVRVSLVMEISEGAHTDRPFAATP